MNHQLHCARPVRISVVGPLEIEDFHAVAAEEMVPLVSYGFKVTKHVLKTANDAALLLYALLVDRAVSLVVDVLLASTSSLVARDARTILPVCCGIPEPQLIHEEHSKGSFRRVLACDGLFL